MATINLGNIKFNWKGTYAGGTAYVVDDVVSYSGSSYICKLASTGNLPTNGTYWDVMSQAGTNGTDISTTLTTQGDILYRDSSGLQRLAKGTAGQALKINSGATAPEWGTISTKVLGYKGNIYNAAVNKGNVNQSASVITQLNTTYGTPVSNASYFVVKVNLCATQYGNHGRAFFQFSTDGGSTWSYSWSNGSDAGVTRSGTGLGWTSTDYYRYAQISLQYDAGDTNQLSNQSATSIYQPSRPHSVSNFQVRVQAFTCSSTSNWYLNRNHDNSSTYGTIGSSSVEIWEILA